MEIWTNETTINCLIVIGCGLLVSVLFGLVMALFGHYYIDKKS